MYNLMLSGWCKFEMHYRCRNPKCQCECHKCYRPIQMKVIPGWLDSSACMAEVH
jgi:hypothetical protein